MSEKRGLEIRSAVKEPGPLLKLTRTGREDAIAGPAGFQPSAFIASHRPVQLRAEVDRPNWPPLPIEQSNGPVIFIVPSATIMSGK